MSKLTNMGEAALQRKLETIGAADVDDGEDDFDISDKELLHLVGMLALVNANVNIPNTIEVTAKNGKKKKVNKNRLTALILPAIEQRFADVDEAKNMDISSMSYDELINLIRQ